MNTLQQLISESLFQSNHLTRIDPNENIFPAKTRKIELYRNDKQELQLKITSKLTEEILTKYRKLAALIKSQRTTFNLTGTHGDSKIFFYGCQHLSLEINKNSELVQVMYVTTHEEKRINKERIIHIREWVCNAEEAGTHSFSDLCEFKEETTGQLKIPADTLQLDIEPDYCIKYAQCITLTIKEHDLLVTLIFSHDKTDPKKSGMILYQTTMENTNLLNDALREKVRNTISYAIGKPLGFLGYNSYTATGEIPHKLSQSIPKTLPLDIWLKSNLSNEPSSFTQISNPETIVKVIEGKFQNFINLILEKYDELDLGYQLNRYWQAIAGIKYFDQSALTTLAGIIEQLLSKEIPRLCSEESWEEVKHKLIQVTKESSIDDSKKNILISKISQDLNRASMSTRIEYLAEKIGLSTLETEALRKRNFSAHGEKIDQSKYLDKDTQKFVLAAKTQEFFEILQITLNRIVLYITGASDTYLDTYSYSYPKEKPVEQPIDRKEYRFNGK